MQGGCRPASCPDSSVVQLNRLALDARRLSPLPAALKTTRGSSRPTCRRRNTCRLVVDARRLSPCLTPGCRSRPTRRLVVDARRRTPFLPLPTRDEVALPAALPWMQGGCRPASCPDSSVVQLNRLALDARRLSPLPAALKTTRGSSRPTCRRRNTCRLVVDARRLSPCLTPGCRSRPTRRLVVDARRRTPYLLP